MMFTSAKNLFYEVLLADFEKIGFFKKGNNVFKVDTKNKYIIYLTLEKLYSGNDLQYSFSLHPLIYNFDYTELKHIQGEMQFHQIKNIFGVETSKKKKDININGQIIEIIDESISLECEIIEIIKVTKEFILPMFEKIGSIRDMYNAETFMLDNLNKGLYRGNDKMLFMSVYLDDWDSALKLIEQKSIIVKDYINTINYLLKNGIVTQKQYEEKIKAYEERCMYTSEQKENILKKNKTYFEKTFEQNIAISISNIKKYFIVEINKGLIVCT